MANPAAPEAPRVSPASTPDTLLQLLWLASPTLPVGGFSYSEGLEAAIEWAQIATEEQIRNWLVDQLHVSLARADLAVVAAAIAAWRAGNRERLLQLSQWVLRTRESAEFRLQTEQMGRSLIELHKLHHADATTAFDGLAPCYPIAFAFAASRTDASVRESCLAFAFAWAENMVASALKAAPLGQSAGQRILGRLVDEIPSAVDAAIRCDDQDRQSFAPMLAILSSRHEAQYSRLFRS